MCKAMDEMLKDSKAEGLTEGETKGEFETCVQLVNDGDISLGRALEKLHMSFDEFYKKKAEFESK
ncbi:MAG: hypothetical protein PUF33_00810 [Solobacterium sp.]|nr:hypothetical protein [Solobacterium sp.]